MRKHCEEQVLRAVCFLGKITSRLHRQRRTFLVVDIEEQQHRTGNTIVAGSV